MSSFKSILVIGLFATFAVDAVVAQDGSVPSLSASMFDWSNFKQKLTDEKPQELSIPFEFQNLSEGPIAQFESRCLPQGQKLLKVTGIKLQSSNNKSSIDAEGSITKNCINVHVFLPPSQEICYESPNPSILHPVRVSEKCTRQIATRLNFDVEYLAIIDKESDISKGESSLRAFIQGFDNSIVQ